MSRGGPLKLFALAVVIRKQMTMHFCVKDFSRILLLLRTFLLDTKLILIDIFLSEVRVKSLTLAADPFSLFLIECDTL